MLLLLLLVVEVVAAVRIVAQRTTRIAEGIVADRCGCCRRRVGIHAGCQFGGGVQSTGQGRRLRPTLDASSNRLGLHLVAVPGHRRHVQGLAAGRSFGGCVEGALLVAQQQIAMAQVGPGIAETATATQLPVGQQLLLLGLLGRWLRPCSVLLGSLHWSLATRRLQRFMLL